MKRLARPFLAGLLAILPIVLTVSIVAWVGALLHRILGPESGVGKLLSSIGFGTDPSTDYILGFVMVVLVIYALGLLVQIGLKERLLRFVDRMFLGLPLIGSVYDMTNRFVSVFEAKDQADLKAMTAVWVHFGGKEDKAGAVILALRPTSEPVLIDGERHQGILAPTAPVPFGGGLLFVPESWVVPAPFGVEALTNIYLSMGVTAPQYANAPKSRGG